MTMRAVEGNELALAWAVDIHCENCGRTRRFSRRALATFQERGCRTFAHLGSRLYCLACQERDAAARNVSLVPHWIKQRRHGQG
ncbi:MAG: hypothetical protein ABWY78_15230 [Microvirga sp.]